MSFLRVLPDSDLFNQWGFEGLILGSLSREGIRVPPLVALGQDETHDLLFGEAGSTEAPLMDPKIWEEDRVRLFRWLGYNDAEWPVQMRVSWAMGRDGLLGLTPEQKAWKQWIPVDGETSFMRDLTARAAQLKGIFQPEMRILFRSGMVTVEEGRFVCRLQEKGAQLDLSTIPAPLHAAVKKIQTLFDRAWKEFGPIEFRYVNDGEEFWITDATVVA